MIQSGQLPEDQLTTTLNTALDFASPSASRDLVAGFGGPSALGDTLGLSPEETEALIRQQVGLQISPGQQLNARTELLGLLPEFITKQQELKIKQQEADTKGREADIKGREATTKAERLEFDIKNASPEQMKQLFDLNLRTIVLNGRNINGKPVSRDTRARAQRLLMLGQQIPGLSAFVQGLVEEKDFDRAGQLLGLSPGAIENEINIFGPNTGGTGDLTPGLGPEPEAIAGQEANQQLDAGVQAFMQQLLQLLGETGLND